MENSTLWGGGRTGLFSTFFKLGKGLKSMHGTFHMGGGQTHFTFFLYPQFIQKCIKFLFGGVHKYSCQKYVWKIFLAKIFLVGIFSAKNIFSENIFDVNIFDNNIFGKNIFFLPSLHLISIQTIPTSSQLLISDFWSWVWHMKLNYGPDGAMFVPIIITDIPFFSEMFQKCFW